MKIATPIYKTKTVPLKPGPWNHDGRDCHLDATGNYETHGRTEGDERGGYDQNKHGNGGEDDAFLFVV